MYIHIIHITYTLVFRCTKYVSVPREWRCFVISRATFELRLAVWWFCSRRSLQICTYDFWRWCFALDHGSPFCMANGKHELKRTLYSTEDTEDLLCPKSAEMRVKLLATGWSWHEFACSIIFCSWHPGGPASAWSTYVNIDQSDETSEDVFDRMFLAKEFTAISIQAQCIDKFRHFHGDYPDLSN